MDSQSVHRPEYLAIPYDLFEGNSSDVIISAKEM